MDLHKVKNKVGVAAVGEGVVDKDHKIKQNDTMVLFPQISLYTNLFIYSLYSYLI